MNNFYVYSNGKGEFIRMIDPLTLKKTKSIGRAAVWQSKRDAKSWMKAVKAKFPGFQIHECRISLKEDYALYSDGKYRIL